MTLLILSVLFFAFLAKDIAVPAMILTLLAAMRSLGLADMRMLRMKGMSR
ncbi:hypothetical protein [Gellertiella hungarica]|uniref:Uncharacterized protein n=1 Tax=Gellertiella hungarica TaxID=1572859 RepID=A0A7W6J8G0_9HYPH|nr:hypothetical protein [Gellertiella hungarica]MBB4066720.1 hypothetical protein [Gellertiella hungarica]